MTKSNDAALDAEARDILRRNDMGGYTVPTAGLYPFQWNWDSCLVALGWATFDEERAWQEIESLFSAQWDDGMVPHIVFHRDDPGYFPGPDVWATGRTPQSSGITQPPVAASVVASMLDLTQDTEAAETTARRLYPKLLAWHRWFRSARDPQGTGLVAILHPWEAGRDNSVDWDDALARVEVHPELQPYTRRDTGHVNPEQRPKQFEYDRYMTLVQTFREAHYDSRVLHDLSPFKVEDVGLNAILLRADRDLLKLATRFGSTEERAEIEGWIGRGETAFQALWSEEASVFRSRDRMSGALVDSTSSGGFLALYAGVCTPEQRARMMQEAEAILATVQQGFPSFDPRDPRFDKLRYWRGPVWLIINRMLAIGLAEAGRPDLARRIREDSRELCRNAGFWEYFDPTTGDGLGGSVFTWTAAMWLAWASSTADAATQTNAAE